jgi:hypothetical protein
MRVKAVKALKGVPLYFYIQIYHGIENNNGKTSSIPKIPSLNFSNIPTNITNRQNQQVITISTIIHTLIL